MIGAIIGDIVGSRFEFRNHLGKELSFFSLFDDDYTDSEKINTFLALLEN